MGAPGRFAAPFPAYAFARHNSGSAGIIRGVNAHSSGERSPANTLTLRLRANVWTATYGAESEDAARILDAFGTLELPLPYTEAADPKLVLRAIRGRNTRYTVVHDGHLAECVCEVCGDCPDCANGTLGRAGTYCYRCHRTQRVMA